MEPRELHLILLEDNASDAELIERELRRWNPKCAVERVSTRKHFIAALEMTSPDIILADYNLPGFNGLDALKLSRINAPDVPFIIISGFLGEELAVEIVRNGAIDYILKERLTRLIPSVTRALKESDERQQRKRAEAQLRESEAQYRALFDGNPQPIWVYDIEDYSVLAVNDAALRHYGHSHGEFLGMTIFDVQPAEEQVRFQEYHESIIREGTGHGAGHAGIWRHRRNNGALFYVELTWNIIPFGGCTGVLVLATDVTERKLAAEALEESEHKLREIIDLVPHFIFVKNEAGQYMLVNKAVAHAYGTTIDSLLMKTDFDFTKSEEEAAKSREDDLYVIRNNRTKYIDPQVFTDFRGERRILQSIKIPFRIKDASNLAVLGMAIDVTDKKLAEEKIIEQARLLDIASDAIIVRDMQGVITLWNRGAEAIYGWSQREALGRNVEELLFQHNNAQYGEAQAAVADQDTWGGEMHQSTKAGKNIIVQSRWTVVRGEEGKPKSVLILNTDITEKKNIEAQFLRAQRMESIGTLASGIAHDLNNVLAPILLTIQNLRRKLPDERSQRMLNTVELTTKRGAEMVQHVLTFTRGAEGEKIPLQPKHLIEEIEKIVRETFARGIRIHARTDRDLWLIRGDATQLHQVLMNLCVNARDAMPGGGTLTIDAENIVIDENFAKMNLDAKPGPHTVITVSDTGTGIPAAVIEKIFEPFFTTKEIGKGTGLGLSTALAIVRGHGGFINVYSEVGKGTHFKIYLPALESQPGAGIAVESRADLPPGHGETILVVDDEGAITEITKDTLESYGYKAIVASDGTEAIALFTQHRDEIRLVLTDMMMPFMDGPATIRALRKIDPDVKVIAASGLVANERSADLESTPVQAFLQKPYTAGKLLRTIDDVLRGGAAAASDGP